MVLDVNCFSDLQLSGWSNRNSLLTVSSATDTSQVSAVKSPELTVPGNNIELERINKQLADEYKYVENLRNEMRQTEHLHEKALQKAHHNLYSYPQEPELYPKRKNALVSQI